MTIGLLFSFLKQGNWGIEKFSNVHIGTGVSGRVGVIIMQR